MLGFAAAREDAATKRMMRAIMSRGLATLFLLLVLDGGQVKFGHGLLGFQSGNESGFDGLVKTFFDGIKTGVVMALALALGMFTRFVQLALGVVVLVVLTFFMITILFVLTFFVLTAFLLFAPYALFVFASLLMISLFVTFVIGLVSPLNTSMV